MAAPGSGRDVQVETEQRSVHTLILGAGPAGLAAAFELARAGRRPTLLEKGPTSGGLMRSIDRAGCTVDIGRKELYARFPDVEALWSELLGSDLRPYPHRFGVLYRGRIFEVSSSYRGVRRGMSWGMFLTCGLDLAWCWARPYRAPPRTYEEYWYRTCGRRFSRILAQPFWERFHGTTWAEASIPPDGLGPSPSSRRDRVRQGLSIGKGSRDEAAHLAAPGTGHGPDLPSLERAIEGCGGRFVFEAEVVAAETSNGSITSVSARSHDVEVRYEPEYVVSSLPPGLLGRLLAARDPRADARRPAPAPRRSTVLAYLFLAEACRFPHAWLEVTCPTMRAGRITNYAAFGGDMVPPGRTALCVEFFCVGDDPLLDAAESEIAALAIRECARARLIDPATCFDKLVLKLPGADAATGWREWESAEMRPLMDELGAIRNLYVAARPGTDRATYAGLLAARAILSGDRGGFDDAPDPSLSPDVQFGPDLISARL